MRLKSSQAMSIRTVGRPAVRWQCDLLISPSLSTLASRSKEDEPMPHSRWLFHRYLIEILRRS